MYTLENEYLKVQIAAHGAELSSIVSNGREYLWEADPKFWGRHAPVLFPIVGKVIGGEYRLGGKTYKLGQHGFARDNDFECVEATQNSVKLILRSNEQLKKVYPFDFTLLASFTLGRRTLKCEWVIENCGTDIMHFQIGGHPAFKYMDYPEEYTQGSPAVEGDSCKLATLSCERGSIRFLNNGKPLESFRAKNISPEVLIAPGDHEIPLTNGCMPLSSTTFDSGVFVLEGSQSDQIQLLDTNGKVYLELRSKTSPVLGVWAPDHKNPPFVCIEPWMGRTDNAGFTGDFSEKPFMNHLPLGQTMTFGYEVEIPER